jgi:hypothetical protein
MTKAPLSALKTPEIAEKNAIRDLQKPLKADTTLLEHSDQRLVISTQKVKESLLKTLK